MRQTYALVDLSKYRANLRAIKSAIGPSVKLMAVVKANAYGHGLVQIARAAQEEQADFLAVALAEEGIILRQAGIHLPILVLAGLSGESTLDAVQHGLTLTVHTQAHLLAAEKAAEALGRTAEVHIKIDTGMNRIGTKGEGELRALLQSMAALPHVKLTGAFTHFASADDPNPAMTNAQLERFNELSQLLPEGILLHTSGSSALLGRPDARKMMVRAGISSYGYSPIATEVPLQPVLSWLAEITHVKEAAAGETISYGGTADAYDGMKLATLAVGYGDGYNRLLSNKAEALINGTRCPVMGRVCMDQIMVDATRAGEVRPGMQATLIGREGNEEIAANDLAGLIGTISYEVLLSISSRVPRVYIND